jgi:hypothetical protein
VNADEASAPSAVSKATGLSWDGFSLEASDGSSTHGVALSWPQDLPFTSFRVRRGMTADPSAMTPLVETGSAGHTDTDVIPLRLYHYQVELLDGEGVVLGSSLVDSGYRHLGAPTGIAASRSVHADRIEITWGAASGAESYRIFRKLATDATAAFWKSVTGTSVNDTEAPAGEDVQYYVQSATAYGNGDASGTAIGRRLISSPAGLSVATGAVPGQLVIRWDASEGAETYRILRGTSADPDDAEEIGSTALNRFVDPGAAPGVPYFYWVIATDQGGGHPGAGDPASGIAGVAETDLLVAGKNRKMLGDGVINRSGRGQSRIARIRRWSRVTVAIRSENDGTLADRMSYRGIGRSSFARISVYRTGPAAKNLTAALRAGLAHSTNLAPGASESLRVLVQPERGARAKRKKRYKFNYQFGSVSGLLDEAADVVRISVTAG